MYLIKPSPKEHVRSFTFFFTLLLLLFFCQLGRQDAFIPAAVDGIPFIYLGVLKLLF